VQKVQDETARSGGTLRPVAVGTVGEWVEAWLRDTVKPNAELSPNTIALYTAMWEHAKSHIGHVRLKTFDVQHVEALVATLRKTSRPSIPAKVCAVLKAAFTVAIKRRKYHFANPFQLVKAPAPRAKEGRALSVVEAKRFLKAAKGTEFEALWVLLLTTGLRLGEALALEWRDVDLRTGALTVRKSLSEVSGECEVRDPKTKGSRRRVELGALGIAALKARHKPEAGGFIFTTSTGGHPRRSNLRQREFVVICKEAKIKGLTIHGLRHSATSLALAKGVPVIAVAGMLGHGTARLVQERYGHMLPTAHRDAALAVDRALRPRQRAE
jgi:integrase